MQNIDPLQAHSVNVNTSNEGSGDTDEYALQCLNEVDSKWKLQWNNTNSETIAHQNCPPGFTGICIEYLNP